jgi:hypothetical protein
MSELVTIRQKDTHYQLRTDLVDHLWTFKGEQVSSFDKLLND